MPMTRAIIPSLLSQFLPKVSSSWEVASRAERCAGCGGGESGGGIGREGAGGRGVVEAGGVDGGGVTGLGNGGGRATCLVAGGSTGGVGGVDGAAGAGGLGISRGGERFTEVGGSIG